MLELIRAYALEFILLAAIAVIYAINLPMEGMFTFPMEYRVLEAARETALAGRWGLPLFNGAEYAQLPPGMIWLVLLFMKPLGATLLSGHLASLLVALVGLVVTYLLASGLFNNRLVALLAAGIQASCWGWFEQAHVVLPASAFTVLFAVAAWLLWEWFTRSRRPKAYSFEFRLLAVLAGICYALLLLTQGTLGLLAALGLGLSFLALTGCLRRLRDFYWRGFWPAFLIVGAPWPIWMTYQEGFGHFLLSYLALKPVMIHPVGEEAWDDYLLRWVMTFVPWLLFMVAPFTSYFNRRSAHRQILDFRMDQIILLLLWLVLGVVLFPEIPVLLIPPLALITAYYLVNAFMEPKMPRSYVLATDGTVLALMIIAVLLSISIFQVLPDEYPGSLWLLPGPAQLTQVTLFKTIDLPTVIPIWKIWLVPVPFMLILIGLALHALLTIERPAWISGALMPGTLLLFLYTALVINPVFERPVDEQLAASVNRQWKPGEKVFVHPDGQARFARTLFYLDPKVFPVILLDSEEAIRSLSQEHVSVWGILDEDDYYALPLSLRNRFQVTEAVWKWRRPPLRLLFPRKNQPRYDNRDYMILVRSAQAPALPPPAK